MSNWTRHATWDGPIVMIGFGSIGRGVLPLILRHIGGDKSRITILDPGTDNKHIADAQGVRYVQQGLTRENYKSVLTPLLTVGPGHRQLTLTPVPRASSHSASENDSTNAFDA